MGVQMLGRYDFLLQTRLRGRPAIIGISLLGVLLLSVLFFLFFGNDRSERLLFFPAQTGRRMVAEERFLPRHRTLEENAAEVAEGVLLGPTRNDALRIFPRGGSVLSALLHGRTLYLDLSPNLLADDSEVPLKGKDALDALGRSLRFNFPSIHEIVFFIDGQLPRFTPKKNI
jgi:hypothetical protein